MREAPGGSPRSGGSGPAEGPPLTRGHRRPLETGANLGRRPLAILCDFDGTVTIEEVSVSLLKRYSGERWRKADALLRSGRLTLRETMKGEFSLIRAPREELEAFLRGIHVRPGFRELVIWARRNRVPILVVSEGLDFYIRAFLGQRRIEVPFRANRAIFTERGISMKFPHANPACDYCGNCKLLHIERLRGRGYTTVFVGDGISDRCASERADVVFARGALLEHCRGSGVPCVPYEDFFDVLRSIIARGTTEAASTAATKRGRRAGARS